MPTGGLSGSRWRAEIFTLDAPNGNGVLILNGGYPMLSGGYLKSSGGQPIALAGLWDRWRSKDKSETKETFTIVTTEPSKFAAQFHNRMPLVLWGM